MTQEIDNFDDGNATLVLGNHLKDYAVAKAALDGGDASIALFKAFAGVLQDQYGKDGWLPLAQRFLKTLIDAESAPTAYN